jgi:serine/threonine-protein kinase
VALAVSPEDASVEVDGAPAEVRGGAVEIAGALGSEHRVRVSKGKDAVTAEVFLTEKGAVPSRLELVPPGMPVAPPKREKKSLPGRSPVNSPDGI